MPTNQTNLSTDPFTIPSHSIVKIRDITSSELLILQPVHILLLDHVLKPLVVVICGLPATVLLGRLAGVGPDEPSRELMRD